MLMVDENIGEAMSEAAKLYFLRFENISFMSEMIVFVYSFLGKLLKSFYKSQILNILSHSDTVLFIKICK